MMHAPPIPRVQSGWRSGLRKAAGFGIIGALGAKFYLLHKLRNLHSMRAEANSSRPLVALDRRSFGRLPRRKQREVVYRKRAQLRDFETITYGGYAPIGGGRRRRWF